MSGPIRLPGMEVMPDGSRRWWPPPAEDDVIELRAELAAERNTRARMEAALLAMADRLSMGDQIAAELRRDGSRSPPSDGPR